MGTTERAKNDGVVLSYERATDSGVREKTIIENGQARTLRESPTRIELYEPRALKPEEQQAIDLCLGLAIAGHC